MDIAKLEHLRRVAINALVADGELRDRLVLKGGNAIDLFYGLATRSSMDLDFSISGDFADRRWLQERADRLLVSGFKQEGYDVFDLTVTGVPANVTSDLVDFWGGYKIEFKLIDRTISVKLGKNPEVRRRNATVLNIDNRRKFKVDISKHEYCESKVRHDCLGTPVFVYSPSLLIAEKLRAICQQMPEYRQFVKSPTGAPRARDFVDIWSVSVNTSVNVTTQEFKELVRNVFAAKRVPLHLIEQIPHSKQFHAMDFQSVKATMLPTAQSADFDFYFEHVARLAESLKPLGMV